jgi:hypothetical protein
MLESELVIYLFMFSVIANSLEAINYYLTVVQLFQLKS